MIIGLTGKSCSGKNIAAEYMEKLGWKVLDLDSVGHDLLIKKKDEIERTFGTSQRRELSKLIFADPEKRKMLENILYPDIVESVLEAEKTNPVVVANGALLHRAGLDRICRLIIYVDASYPVRLMRALSRDSISEHDFKMRDDAQTDVHFEDVKYACPVVVLDNEIDCSKQLADVCKKISSGQDIL